ncbi:MAG: rhomboid family intramembrane serine protease [Ignavibacteria bacterium]|jgi:membrane associated rhomboid family serine protease
MGFGDRDYYRPSGFGGFSFFPPVIKKLLIINGIVFFIQVIAENIVIGNMLVANWISLVFGIIPLGGYGDYIFLPWQLITYQFLHGSFGHILMNMFILWMFGIEIENLWGSKKFLFYYLGCGAVAGLFQLFLAPIFAGGGGPTIGASGAVFGVMIAFAMFFPERYIYLYFLIPVKAKYLIVFIMVIEFMSVGDMSFTAHLAHIGGAIAGFLFVMYDRRRGINVENLFSSFKDKFTTTTSNGPKFRKSFNFGSRNGDVQEASFYDISDDKKDHDKIDQDEIDRILDKISESGYQNLTEREKKILFEASKRD